MSMDIDRVQEAIGWLEIALQQGGNLGGKRREVQVALGQLRAHREAETTGAFEPQATVAGTGESSTDRADVSAAAGYKVPGGSALYRDYVITPSGGWGELAWAYQHRNYGGPGDGRCGTTPTVEAAKAEIDERIDEGFDDNALPVGYAVRLGGAA